MSHTEMERTKGCCGPLPEMMTAENAARVARTMKAVADPARVRMLHMLAEARAPICVCDFTAVLGLGQATISHHLARLRDAGFIATEKKGIWSFFQLRADLDLSARAALEAVRVGDLVRPG